MGKRKVGQGNRSGLHIELDAEVFHNVTAAVKRAVNEALNDVGSHAAQDARDNHWFNNQTGNTEAGIRYEVGPSETGEGVSLVLLTDTHYAEYLEDRESFLAAPLDRAVIGFEDRLGAKIKREIRRV